MAYDKTFSSSTDQEIEEIVERKLIKEGWVEFETYNLSDTKKTVLEAVDKYKAYVSSDQENNLPDRNSNTLVLRIPTDDFDNFLQAATQGIDRLDNKNINVQDVTEEFLDIGARLKTKKKLEARYLELLNQANNVTEILEVEKQLSQLRADIESIEGRLNYLQSRISLSTLSLTFYQKITPQTRFGQKFQSGLKNGWNNLIWFFVMLTNIWPFILITIGFIIGVKFYRRKK